MEITVPLFVVPRLIRNRNWCTVASVFSASPVRTAGRGRGLRVERSPGWRRYRAPQKGGTVRPLYKGQHGEVKMRCAALQPSSPG
eukprot:6237385-Heterocapsa_arctica.AAC.1